VTETLDTKIGPEADRALKAKHRSMWALGDYAAIGNDVIAPMGPLLVEAAGIRAGQRLLDVAAGTGNVAIPAALTGADVVASDLTPELLDIGRRAAERRGVTLRWETADAEALPYENASFDVVTSCVGVMFRTAPPGGRRRDDPRGPARRHHRIGELDAGGLHRAALRDDEAVRTAASARRAARAAVGPRGARARAVRRPRHGPHCRTPQPAGRSLPEAFRDFFKAVYGPTIAAYRGIADDPSRVAELDAALVELARRHDRGDGVQEWEFLLVRARRGNSE
jgi:SAM-dependent methyltransferase